MSRPQKVLFRAGPIGKSSSLTLTWTVGFDYEYGAFCESR